MTSLVVCQKCDARLGAPAGGVWPARIECPFCYGQFDVTPASIVELISAKAVVVHVSATPSTSTPSTAALAASRPSNSTVDIASDPTNFLPPRIEATKPPLWEADLPQALSSHAAIPPVENATHALGSPSQLSEPSEEVDEIDQGDDAGRSFRDLLLGREEGASLGDLDGLWRNRRVVVGSIAVAAGLAAIGLWRLFDSPDQIAMQPIEGAGSFVAPPLSAPPPVSESNQGELAWGVAESADALRRVDETSSPADLEASSPSPIVDASVVPASTSSPLDAPSDPVVETSNMGAEADRKSEENLPWPVTPLLGNIRDPDLVDLAALRAAYDQAYAALPEFLAGNLSDSESVSKKGRAYMTLCELARTLTMLEPMALQIPVISQQAQGKELLRSAMSEETNRRSLAQIATRWWEYRERPSAGIFLEGTIREVRAVGPWTEYEIEASWDGGGVVVPVLCDQSRHATGSEVAVIGVVVDEPLQTLGEYDASVPQIVLAGYMISTQKRSDDTVGKTVRKVTTILMEHP